MRCSSDSCPNVARWAIGSVYDSVTIEHNLCTRHAQAQIESLHRDGMPFTHRALDSTGVAH